MVWKLIKIVNSKKCVIESNFREKWEQNMSIRHCVMHKSYLGQKIKRNQIKTN